MSDAVPAPAARRMSSGRILLTAGLTLALVLLLLTQVSIGRIVEMIRRADLFLLVIASAAYTLSYFGRAARWRMLTHSRKLSWGVLLGISAVHNFMLRALPSKLGETSYVVMMRSRGVSGTEALAGLVVARIYDTAAAILFFVLSIFLAHTRLSSSPAANLAAAAVVLLLCGLAVLKGSLVVRWVNRGAGKLARARWMPSILLGHGVRRRLDRLELDLEKIQSIRQAPLLLLATFAIWVPSFFQIWWLLQAFATPFSFWGCVFASTLSLVATLLPVGTLGNFGTQEAGWTFGLMLLGADRQTAIATGFSTHLVGFALAGLLGLIGAWMAAAGGAGQEPPGPA